MRKILWDLDGTIAKSEEGVTKCVQYALAHFGIHEPDLEKLKIFIGPPLRQQFMAVYHLTEEQAEEAVVKYRERYAPIGMYECELYPDVEETLAYFQKMGYKQALASSKNESACVAILKNLKIDQYFDLIGGATDDGRISQKVDVLKMVMERLGDTNPKEFVLIGDTKFDVNGANSVNMDCIGVTFGYGTRKELQEAGAVCVCDTLEEVKTYIENL